ncbi:hypothetical protein PPTG_23637 [Phytophthora nicotianae INRA-310]|uniref:Uncharacterized protein n=1 Tax=Phytophthora nicotianae (strain INRA-310) TaxID=761204 RepID=W2PTA7_PHYN3|nr:hypothetical protein PPTG_23637 [Phytophthora nicotianae INRA-310]ETN04193.1 hypothetical protein PPTG_23637 [Phytophthora nicotianae INRA-310]
MENVTKAVEKKIGDEMPDKFGLLLDWWSHGTEHYLGVFACYETPRVRSTLCFLWHRLSSTLLVDSTPRRTWLRWLLFYLFWEGTI